MSPECQKCGSKFEGKDFNATENSTVPCPSCGENMEVHYSFKDSATDPNAWFHLGCNFRSLKYVPKGRLCIYLLIIIGIIVAGVLMGAF